MTEVILKVENEFLPQLSQVANECMNNGLLIREVNQLGFIVGYANEEEFSNIQQVSGVFTLERTDDRSKRNPSD